KEQEKPVLIPTDAVGSGKE
ncbi:hypothetical protein A2U01_0104109, partial [Trifolium medium]|nr:hypothetical protein [Trifolium medium]